MSIHVSDDERELLRRRIDCPVSWCCGLWTDHGGDGQAPDEWLHDEDEPLDVGHGATIQRSQVGSGPVEWSLAMRGEGATYTMMSSTDPAEFARTLRQIAAGIEEARMTAGGLDGE